jgi:Fe(II)/alpha-ketoglutarate-dependent arginine beta-hydroxylase
MIRYEITHDDLTSITSLAEDIARRYQSLEDDDFLEVAATYAQELPRGLRRFLNALRLAESSAACVISGYPVDDARIGPTPAHWLERPAPNSTLEIDISFLLCACLLGDPIAWSTQQDGRVMHDVLPIRNHEWEQLGSGSREILTWHTEEAFHPLRADYIGLMCLRNPDKVETTYASVEDIALSPEAAKTLREPIFPIRPDRSHLPANRGSADLDGKRAELTERCYAWIEAMDANPAGVAVFDGADDKPYLRADPYFMDLVREDARAAAALAELCEQIDANIKGYALVPGEILFLDNYRAVHGRRAFQARFDGTDRWLKRLNVTRDLRKSRASRERANSRVIY